MPFEYMVDEYLTPPAEAEPIMKCASCGEALYEGQEVVEMDGEYYCDDSCLIERLYKDGMIHAVALGDDV